MTGRTHIIAGVAVGIIASQFVPTIKQKAMLIGGCWIGSLIPDIDTPNSMISKATVLIHYLFSWCGHRKLTHSILGVLLFSLVIILLGVNALSIGLIMGYMSHLLMDSLTVQGIPILYPKLKRYRIGKVRTGSEQEMAVAAVIVLGVILYFYLLLNIGGIK